MSSQVHKNGWTVPVYWMMSLKLFLLSWLSIIHWQRLSLTSISDWVKLPMQWLLLACFTSLATRRYLIGNSWKVKAFLKKMCGTDDAFCWFIAPHSNIKLKWFYFLKCSSSKGKLFLGMTHRGSWIWNVLLEFATFTGIPSCHSSGLEFVWGGLTHIAGFGFKLYSCIV